MRFPSRLLKLRLHEKMPPGRFGVGLYLWARGQQRRVCSTDKKAMIVVSWDDPEPEEFEAMLPTGAVRSLRAMAKGVTANECTVARGDAGLLQCHLASPTSTHFLKTSDLATETPPWALMLQKAEQAETPARPGVTFDPRLLRRVMKDLDRLGVQEMALGCQAADDLSKSDNGGVACSAWLRFQYGDVDRPALIRVIVMPLQDSVAPHETPPVPPFHVAVGYPTRAPLLVGLVEVMAAGWVRVRELKPSGAPTGRCLIVRLGAIVEPAARAAVAVACEHIAQSRNLTWEFDAAPAHDAVLPEPLTKGPTHGPPQQTEFQPGQAADPRT